MDSPWHFHEEFELLYIIKGYGKRIVGNNVSNFENNDMVFMGPNLPHVWKSPEEYYLPKKTAKDVEVICLQFNEQAFGEFFFNIPEMEPIKKLFKESSKGLCITGKVRDKIAHKLREMVTSEYINRFIGLMEILKILSEANEYTTLSTVSYSNYSFHSESDRLEKALNYISANYKKDISLGEIASFCSMSETGFCRYFKKTTLKSFTTYLNELRVNNACILLQEDKLSISQIIYECGFRTLSNFNKVFKSKMKMIPTDYRRFVKKAL